MFDLKRTIPLLLASLLLTAANAIAQTDDDAKQAAEKNSSASTTVKRENKPKADPTEKKAKDKVEVFVPSEEISEDLSVSFPVDI